MARQFKYHSSFASTPVKCILDKEKSTYLAKASIEDLKALLPPTITENGWDDLLPIAGNSCVVNWENKNHDAINTEAALAIASYFVRKFIDLEHDRDAVVGVIESSSFSEFDINYATGSGSKLLTAEQVTSMKGPFNMAISGYVWKIIAPGVVEKILECNDPTSPIYLGVSFSWELGFDSYQIAIGPQNLEECEIISDPVQIEAYSSYLVQNGGTGKLDDGRAVYRLIALDSGAVPLGVGLTFSPAAAVAGVVTQQIQPNNNNKDAKDTKAAETKENNSQSTTTNVITNNETKLPISMKVLKNINDLRSLNDETAKEYSFANISSVLDKSNLLAEVDVAKALLEYQTKLDAEKAEKDKAAQELVDATSKATKEIEDLKKTNKALQDQLNVIQNKQAVAEATIKFNERMQAIDEAYDLTDEMRESVAKSINALSDDSYAEWLKNFSNLAHKSKKVVVENTEDAKTVAAKALASVIKNQTAASTPPNTPALTDNALIERMAAAFTKENLKITPVSLRRKGAVVR